MAEQIERVPCAGSPADSLIDILIDTDTLIDTLEDLRSWQRRSSTNSP